MSAAVANLLAELGRHCVTIERRGDRLKMRAPAAPPADLLERIRARKEELLAALPDTGATVVRTVVKFRLRGGCPRSNCAAIGTRSRDEIIADLRERFGDQLAEVLR